MSLAFAGGMVVTVTTVSADDLYLSESAVLHQGMQVRDALKAECDPQIEVPRRLKAAVERYSHSVALVPTVPVGPEKLSVAVEITSLYAPGGGGWSWGVYGKLGLKQITVRTTFYDGQEAIDSLTRTGSGKGGALGKFRSTCGILMREVDELAEETAEWIEKKVQGSRFRRGKD